MPFFMNPLAFYAGSALLVLGGIYLFRRQSRDVKVSTLMFWSYVKTPAEGGRKITVSQTPLILLLELLILTLFVIAAADPRAIIGEELMPLVVILDDSFSMAAGSGESPKDRAMAYLEKEILSKDVYRISLIRAGVHPEFIGRRDMIAGEAEQLIANWRCVSPISDLDEAIKLAAESFDPGTRILVITDTKPSSEIAENISWNGFGQPLKNLAITSVSRYSLGRVDRCFIEFSNLSFAPAELKAEILDITTGNLIEKLSFKMSPNSVRRVRFSLKSHSSVVTAEIKNDPIAFDNKIWLMPVRKSPVKVMLADLPDSLRKLMNKTLASAENAFETGENPDIVFSTNEKSSGNLHAWDFSFDVASQPVLARGLVTMDRNHKVCEGLPETRGAWAINPAKSLQGYPLLAVGNTTLLSLKSNLGRKHFFMNFIPEYSNVQQTSFWPVLFWNIFSWRQSLNPGPADFNFRSGMEISVNAPAGIDEIAVRYPAGKVEKYPVWEGTCAFWGEETGLYSVSSPNASWTVAVNLVSREESNLADRTGFRPDLEKKYEELIKHSSDVRWWFIVPALLLLLWHQWLINRRRQQYVY